MARLSWIGLLALLALEVRAGELSGRLRLQVGQEYDSNARRIYDLTGEGVPDDFLTRLVLQGELDYTSGAHQLGLDLQTGAKLFYQQTDEHQVATRLQLDYRHLWPPSSASGLRLILHDVTQARHSRDYTLFTGEAFLRTNPIGSLTLEAWAGARGFYFKPDALAAASCPAEPDLDPQRFSNLGPALGLRLQARMAASWTAWLGYAFEVRFFDDRARPQRTTDRQDLRHGANVGVRFAANWYRRLQLIAQSSYTLVYDDSNSAGSSAVRHRVRAVLSLQLPLDFTLHLMGTLQFTSFPDQFYLDCNNYEPDADENENAAVLRLAYRLWADLDLVLQAAIYRDDFRSTTAEQPSFARETVLLGVSWGWEF